MASGRPARCSVTSGIARSTVGAGNGASSARPSTRDSADPRFVRHLAQTRPSRRSSHPLREPVLRRGEAENRIGEQFELFADGASSATMAADQLRMWFSAMAYVLVDTLRRVGLRFTQFADASAQTIRLRLLKLGAQVRTSVRRIHFAIASGCPTRPSMNWLTSIYGVSRLPACDGHHAEMPRIDPSSHDTNITRARIQRAPPPNSQGAHKMSAQGLCPCRTPATAKITPSTRRSANRSQQSLESRLAALCTHMYLNRDISHMDGFAGGNEIRGVQVQRAHAHAAHAAGQFMWATCCRFSRR